jgi:hypothetical protein
MGRMKHTFRPLNLLIKFLPLKGKVWRLRSGHSLSAFFALRSLSVVVRGRLVTKTKGSTMLEPLTAVVIISIILTLAAVSFTSMIKNHDLGIKSMAQESIEEIKLKETQSSSVKNESFSYELFDIDLTYSNYNGFGALKQQSFTVVDKAGEEILVKNYLIHDE